MPLLQMQLTYSTYLYTNCSYGHFPLEKASILSPPNSHVIIVLQSVNNFSGELTLPFITNTFIIFDERVDLRQLFLECGLHMIINVVHIP